MRCDDCIIACEFEQLQENRLINRCKSMYHPGEYDRRTLWNASLIIMKGTTTSIIDVKNQIEILKRWITYFSFIDWSLELSQKYTKCNPYIMACIYIYGTLHQLSTDDAAPWCSIFWKITPLFQDIEQDFVLNFQHSIPSCTRIFPYEEIKI